MKRKTFVEIETQEEIAALETQVAIASHALTSYVQRTHPALWAVQTLDRMAKYAPKTPVKRT